MGRKATTTIDIDVTILKSLIKVFWMTMHNYQRIHLFKANNSWPEIMFSIGLHAGCSVI